MKEKTTIAAATTGLLLIAAGILMPMVEVWRGATPGDIFRYIYAAGAVILLVSRLLSPYKGSDLRQKRLHRIETWSALFFCAGAFFLFYDKQTFADTLAFTLAGGAVQVYTSIMIGRRSN